jgi:hypothetical protein
VLLSGLQTGGSARQSSWNPLPSAYSSSIDWAAPSSSAGHVSHFPAAANADGPHASFPLMHRLAASNVILPSNASADLNQPVDPHPDGLCWFYVFIFLLRTC